MTRDETSALGVLIGEFRQFRDQDAQWKNRIGQRLQLVEEHIAGQEAVQEKEAARGVSRRAYVAATIAAIGILVSIVLSIVNILV